MHRDGGSRRAGPALAVGNRVIEGNVAGLADAEVLEVRAGIKPEGAVIVVDNRALGGLAVDGEGQGVVGIGIGSGKVECLRRAVLDGGAGNVSRHRAVVGAGNGDGDRRRAGRALAVGHRIIKGNVAGLADAEVLEVGAGIESKGAVAVIDDRAFGGLIERIGQGVAVNVGGVEGDDPGHAVLKNGAGDINGHRSVVDAGDGHHGGNRDRGIDAVGNDVGKRIGRRLAGFQIAEVGGRRVGNRAVAVVGDRTVRRLTHADQSQSTVVPDVGQHVKGRAGIVFRHRGNGVADDFRRHVGGGDGLNINKGDPYPRQGLARGGQRTRSQGGGRRSGDQIGGDQGGGGGGYGGGCCRLRGGGGVLGIGYIQHGGVMAGMIRGNAGKDSLGVMGHLNGLGGGDLRLNRTQGGFGGQFGQLRGQ